MARSLQTQERVSQNSHCVGFFTVDSTVVSRLANNTAHMCPCMKVSARVAKTPPTAFSKAITQGCPAGTSSKKRATEVVTSTYNVHNTLPTTQDSSTLNSSTLHYSKPRQQARRASWPMPLGMRHRSSHRHLRCPQHTAYNAGIIYAGIIYAA